MPGLAPTLEEAIQGWLPSFAPALSYAGIAPTVERLICNQDVVGSNPITSSFLVAPHTELDHSWCGD